MRTECKVVNCLRRALALKLFFHSTICIQMGAKDIYRLSVSLEGGHPECQSRLDGRESTWEEASMALCEMRPQGFY